MPDLAALWSAALPEIRDTVTGVGVWTALNACRPIAIEDGVLVLGLPERENELAGHLKLPAARKAIEDVVARELGSSVHVRIIQGTEAEDWAAAKEGDAVKRKLAEQAMERARAELNSRSSWEGLYDKLSRKFAETPNRSLPQNRARFFLDAVDIVAAALIETPITDDLAERNFARCIERIAQYSEIPSALVATKVLEKAFQQ
jgi:hypothetical protein